MTTHIKPTSARAGLGIRDFSRAFKARVILGSMGAFGMTLGKVVSEEE